MEAGVGLRSPRRLAFVHFLRTGFHVPDHVFGQVSEALETKFNPYHDPTNGQFTSGPSTAVAGPASDRADASSAPTIMDGVYQVGDGAISLLQPIGALEPPRGFGDNGGGFYDPTSLAETFPGLDNAPGGSIIAVADNVLQLSNPANEMTSAMSLDYSRALIADIKQYDPNFRFESLGFPDTFSGQMRQINDLRWDRAVAIYYATGDSGPLQVETLRYLQDRTDAEYKNALAAAKAGELPPAPTQRMAIGNYVDKAVKEDFRDILAVRGLSMPSGRAVQVSNREYNTSGDGLTYSIPDVRVDDTAMDISLYEKTLTTRQIRRFFGSDFKPRSVVIIRPRQLGSGSTYIITRPGR